MSVISINHKFEAGSKDAFDKQVKRLNTELGKEPAECVKVGTIAALRSMQASTKISPRLRKVKSDPRTRSKNNRVNGMKRFVIETIDRRTGGLGSIFILAPDLATAKLSPKRTIKKRGLAKASWGHAMHRLFSVGSPDAKLESPTGSLIVSKHSDNTTGFYQTFIENRLNYISKALSGGKGPSVATALSRAAATMKGRTDQRVKGEAQNWSKK